jgi:hypothetical protein
LFDSRDHTGGVFSGLRTDRGHEEDGGEGDYLDHFQQPGNTKKRKVPANLAAIGPGYDSGSGGSGEDEPADRAIPTGRPDHDYEATAASIVQGQTGHSHRKKLSKATLAGLQHKEMLRNRKRQLAVVLGALAHGNTLALDQALSANRPFAQGSRAAATQSQDLVKVRLSRRPAARLARAYKALQATLPVSDTRHSFPQSDFEFMFHSASKYTARVASRRPFTLHA